MADTFIGKIWFYDDKITIKYNAQDGKTDIPLGEPFMTTDLFISTVRRYTRIKKLNERTLNELIERIEVHQAEKIGGVHRQKFTIHYNCVGAI